MVAIHYVVTNSIDLLGSAIINQIKGGLLLMRQELKALNRGKQVEIIVVEDPSPVIKSYSWQKSVTCLRPANRPL